MEDGTNVEAEKGEDHIYVLPEDGANVKAKKRLNMRPKRTENPKSFKYIPEWMDDASVQELL